MNDIDRFSVQSLLKRLRGFVAPNNAQEGIMTCESSLQSIQHSLDNNTNFESIQANEHRLTENGWSFNEIYSENTRFEEQSLSEIMSRTDIIGEITKSSVQIIKKSGSILYYERMP